MEQTTKTPFDKSAYKPALFRGYKIVKKVLKYSIYASILFFAYEGFMMWQ